MTATVINPERRKRMRLLELGLAAAIVILIGVLLLLAVRDAERRSRDLQRLADVRSVQASLEGFRRADASYPATIDPILPGAKVATPMAYVATPDGCSDDGQSLCTGYVISFQLESQVGGLTGGSCTAGPLGVACVVRK